MNSCNKLRHRYVRRRQHAATEGTNVTEVAATAQGALAEIARLRAQSIAERAGTP